MSGRCILCKLHPNNPISKTNGCAHKYEEAKTKQKQVPKEKWLPYCPFCGTRILPAKTFYDEDTGQVIATKGISVPCWCIGDNELCCVCFVCRLHLHLDCRKPGS